MQLVGSVGLELWVESSGPEADIFAYLEDVSPEGDIRCDTSYKLHVCISSHLLAVGELCKATSSTLPSTHDFCSGLAGAHLGRADLDSSTDGLRCHKQTFAETMSLWCFESAYLCQHCIQITCVIATMSPNFML